MGDEDIVILTPEEKEKIMQDAPEAEPQEEEEKNED